MGMLAWSFMIEEATINDYDDYNAALDLEIRSAHRLEHDNISGFR